MRATATQETTVGILASLVLAGILGVSYSAQEIDKVSQMGGDYHLVAVFNQVDGLSVGDEVMLSGIPVGEVEEMLLDKHYRARVSLQINEDISLPVDTSAAVHTDGLFGSKYIVLDPGGAEETLTDGSSITFTQDAVIVGDLLDLIISEGRAIRGMTKEAD